MKIACNWSRQLKELLVENNIDLDYIKCGICDNFFGDYTNARKYKPVLIHGLGYFEETGMKDVSIVDFEKANAVINYCQSPHYGLHLGIQKTSKYEGLDENQIFDRMSANIIAFKENLDVPLLLESAPDSKKDRTYFHLYPYVKPQLINDIIIKNDVGFLLDLSHVKVSAIFNNWDIKEYIEALPLDQVKEIHVNGAGYDVDGNITDMHDYMKEDDYQLLEWTLTKCSPDIISLEYSGVEGQSFDFSKNMIADQIKRIKNIM